MKSKSTNTIIQYCEHCDKEVTCNIVEKYETMNSFGNEASILTKRAYCPHCQNEIWVGKWIQTLFTVNLPFNEACHIWFLMTLS